MGVLRRLPTGALWGCLLVICLLQAPVPAAAQSLGTVVSPILTVQSDILFERSAFGQRIAQEIDTAQSELQAENSRIQAELTAEETDLVEKRKEMTPEEFAPLAEAFDEKVRDRVVIVFSAHSVPMKVCIAKYLNPLVCCTEFVFKPLGLL